MTDEEIYRGIARELSLGTKDQALWMRAFAEMDGDTDRTKAQYIRLRYAAIKEAGNAPAAQRPAAEEEAAGDKALADLRFKLDARLVAMRRTNFYSALGLRATARQQDIRAAVEDLRGRGDGVGARRAEQAYAIETLMDPEARERYDRKMWAELSGAGGARTQAADVDLAPPSTVLALWESRKMSVILGGVLLFAAGYLLLGFSKDKTTQQAVGAVVSAQREAVQVSAENEKLRLENERIAVEKAADLVTQSIALREQSVTRQRLEQENRAAQRAESDQRERERRALLEQDRQRRDKQREEERTAERTKRYWTCMNSSLERTGYSSAEQRCGSLR